MQIAQWVFRQAFDAKCVPVTKEPKPHNAFLENGPCATAVLADEGLLK